MSPICAEQRVARPDWSGAPGAGNSAVSKDAKAKGGSPFMNNAQSVPKGSSWHIG